MYGVDDFDKIWQSYRTTTSSLKIVKRNILDGNIIALGRNDFTNEPKDEVLEKINESHKNADEFVILSLWVVFERILFQYVQNENKKNNRKLTH
jgi:hypothetical protein